MRIVSKCIANRMTTVMKYLVGDYQNAFVKGRQISDNIMIAHEALKNIERHKTRNSWRFAFKTDMSKDYDRMRWDFVRKTLQVFGFPDKLVSLIMNCVTTVTYEVLVNGTPTNHFAPQNGLRQGDPLSPYTFILCMEVLSYNITMAEQRGSLHDNSLGRYSASILHLFFVDDSILFLEDKDHAFQSLKGILDDFCKISGQRLNEHKSGIIFRLSTTIASPTTSLSILNIQKNEGIDKYIGMETDWGLSKKALFNGLIERVQKRLLS